MAPQNPTIIVGHLDDSELTKSIDKLVAEVAKKTSGMAEDFTRAIDEMKFAMKDFAVTQKVSVDLMKEAWRDMSKSFDAMVAAQSAATGGGKGSGKGKVYAPNTVGALEQEIALEKEKRREMELGSDVLRDQNRLLEQRQRTLKQETTSLETNVAKAFQKRIGNVTSLPSKTFADANEKLRRLRELLDEMQKRPFLFDESKINRVKNAIDSVETKIERMRKKWGQQGQQPNTLQQVLGMDENSFDAISKKMAALKKLSWSNPQEQKQLISEYQRLRQEQTKLMASNARMSRSNNYLAQSFGYIRNRIVYALTLGAITNFVKQLYEIRGQYELLERSLGVLVGSFEKGTQIFNELNEMAIKSPFTLIELGTAAKQLTAYNFAANEVVDTTRRLADISAALGVPMERLTYNLGQIKAQGVLNARDARDFANAGLAIVPMLAKMYTEQKTFGDEMVTTAQVYDMMSKKMVTYSDVLKVLYRVTDEGGKFFDFQAKQADTLKVQMANLTLAYNNMLNEIGSENQGILSGMVSGLKTLLKNWKEISRAILTLVTTLGTYKAVATIVSALNSRMFVGSVLVGLRNYILGIKNATGAMATFNAVTKANPIAFLISALVAAIGYFALFNHKVKETTVEMERFGENASKQIKKVETLGKVLAGVEEGSSTYKRALSELNQTLSEYGITEIKNRDQINAKIQETIQLIKEEGKERQYANNIAKGEERYINDTGQAKSSLNEGLLGLEGWFGTTSNVKREILDNAEAITDIASSIIEENIGLIVNKTGQEAYDGLIEIQNRVRRGLKNSGLSNSAIDFILDKGYINAAIKDYRIATEEHERYNQKIKGYYDAATKATQATMTFTQKVDANARALRNNTEDAISLYNRVYDIVKIAKENHTINFDLKLTAEKPPKWMLDKSLPELQQLAERFTAIAQSGGRAKGYDRESTYERGLMYASAARIKQEEEERKSRQKDKKTRTKQSDEIAKAIKNEISLVKQLQSAYDTLTKKGDSHANAIAKVQDLYGKTIDLLNKDMDKFGLPRLDLSIIKGNNHNEVLAFFEKLRDVLESKGLSNIERMEAVEGVVKEFRLKAETYNLDMITKGLNNELGKLKDEYELAVELDANPELGGIFADWMGFDINELPKNAEEAAKKAQQYIDKILRENKSKEKIDIASLMGKDAFDKWIKSSGHGMEDDLVKVVDNYRKTLHKMQVDESKKQIQEWGKLLEKYAEYEYKVSQIQKEAEREREVARKKGASQEIFDAINERERQELARVSFEEFQKSPEWIVATGDLANMSKLAIGMLIEELEKYKRSAKDLSPKQIKQLNQALRNLYKEQRKNNPFKAIVDMLDEAKKRMATFDDEIKKIEEEIRKAQEAVEEAYEEGGDVSKPMSALSKLQDKLKELKENQEKAGKVDASGWVDAIKGVVSAVQSAISVFKEFAEAISGTDMGAIDDMFTVIDKAFKGAEVGASVGGVYGAIVGGVLGAATAIISLFSSAANQDITDKVKLSEKAVKRLEIAYKDLEYEIEKAYGMAEYGARRAAIANKQLQLVELQRQLRLEESRSAKYRDAERIYDLKSQIADLKNEIIQSIDDITNDMLGITSVGNAAEELVSSMIDAFKKGEDYMLQYDESFEKMIDNMIMKAIVSRVVGDRIEEMWNQVKAVSEARGEDERKRIEELVKKQEEAERKRDMYETWAESDSGVAGLSSSFWKDAAKNANNEIERIKKALEQAEKDYAKAIEPTREDVDSIRNMAAGWREDVKNEFEYWMGAFGIGFGEDAENKQLSNLQQGISGITEDTAGAIESYLNIVSQRMFYHGSLLEQIRDAVVGFNMDVQVATQAQMLLQLQQSYQVQMSIESILQGVLNPSGRAFSVELVS